MDKGISITIYYYNMEREGYEMYIYYLDVYKSSVDILYIYFIQQSLYWVLM